MQHEQRSKHNGVESLWTGMLTQSIVVQFRSQLHDLQLTPAEWPELGICSRCPRSSLMVWIACPMVQMRLSHQRPWWPAGRLLLLPQLPGALLLLQQLLLSWAMALKPTDVLFFGVAAVYTPLAGCAGARTQPCSRGRQQLLEAHMLQQHGVRAWVPPASPVV
jgi:hypothetical protein